MNSCIKSFYINCGIIFPITLLASNVFPAYGYEDIPNLTQENSENLLKKVIAQNTDDNRDRFLQFSLKPLPEPKKIEPILTNPTDTPTNSEAEAIEKKPIPEIDPAVETEAKTLIPVEKVSITGSTIFTPEELKSITKSLEGRSATLEEIQEIAKEITRLYLAKGYITSRAILPEQEIEDGNIEIRVIEGSIADINIEGNNRVGNDYIRKRLELGTDTPVRVDLIEERLQLLKAGSLIEGIEANIQPAKGEGQSNLMVEVDEANLWVLGANLDNYETVNTGAERIGVTLGYLDITGNQDSLITSFNHSLSASSWSLNANYSLPVNAKDGTLQLRTNIERNEIVGDDFESLDLEGDSELYEVSFRQPIINTLPKEFALSLGFSFQESRDFLNGVRLNGTNRTSVIKFGQDYTKRGVKGVWALRSQLNLGFDGSDDGEVAPNEEDQLDDVFVSWLGQAQRLQRINPSNLLIMQADLQFTPSDISPSEQFVIGGAQSVRGYRQNARLGDNGFRFSVEDRIALVKNQEDSPIFQLAPFADLGVVWNNSSNDPDDNFLAGIGLGLLWEPISNLNIRLDYAPPLIELDDKGDNIQEDGLYFSVNYFN